MKYQQRHLENFSRILSKTLHLQCVNQGIDFLISYLISDNPFYSTNDIIEWLGGLNQKNHMSVDVVPLSLLNKWSFDDSSGDITHNDNGFFEIRGLQCFTNWGEVQEWEQPIIYQPEVGILGIITKKFNGILYFLLQAKIEPGNINGYQLSPTVQATRSNYNQVHGGKPTQYIEFFKEIKKYKIHYDQFQSEQGTRFYKKRNRNIIIEVGQDTLNETDSNYCWLTLRQINSLLKLDNIINMDTRSVISGIDLIPKTLAYTEEINKNIITQNINDNISLKKSELENCINFIHSIHPNSYSYHPTKDLLAELTKNKFDYYTRSTMKPLKYLRSWSKINGRIVYSANKYFSVIGIRVKAVGREVNFWDQPIIKQEYPGTIGFLEKEINGTLHLLVHLKMECGFIDSFEIAPTVQCVAENYPLDGFPAYYSDIIKDKGKSNKFDTYQSEEGGRFYMESNRNIIKLVDSSFPIEEQKDFFWVTLNQLKDFLQYTSMINIEARSLISCMGVY